MDGIIKTQKITSAMFLRAKSGKEDAINQLIEIARPIFKAWGRQILQISKGKDDVSDLAQDVSMILAQKITDIEGQDVRQLISWLKIVLKRRAIAIDRHYSQQKRDVAQETSPGDSEFSLEKTIAGKQPSPSFHLKYKEQVARLGPVAKDIFELRVNGFGVDEIGEIVGLTGGQVSGHLRTIRDKVDWS